MRCCQRHIDAAADDDYDFPAAAECVAAIFFMLTSRFLSF